MSALIPIGLGVLALALGYIVYSRLVTKWLVIDYNIKVPSRELHDGVDYVPAKHWTILFGHHFASIAGAAPIIGPVIACYVWGWFPAVLWIVIGGVFFGAVHDYFALTYSVQHKGRSVCDLSERVLGKLAKVAFSAFVLLALILVVAVFAALAGITLAGTPQVVIPTFGLIFVAVIVGLLVYRTNIPLLVDTLIGLVLLFGLIVLGYYVPVNLPEAIRIVPFGFSITAAQCWTILLLLYAIVASVLPVSLLLQPRDHLAAGVLFIGMLFGFVGILIARPTMKAPRFVAFTGNAGWLWPMLFVTIACGAISGFHSLVASGTTSKQLPRMRDARPIGYGGMILECALALLAVICVTAGLYWKSIPAGVRGHLYQDLASNPIKAFGTGYGEMTSGIFGALGMLVGITMLKTFIMTTLDSATRITRYVCSELLADTFGLKPFRNRYVSTIVIGVAAGALALGNWRAIWPIFGSSNQLIAAMVLIIATVYLLTRGRKWVFAAVPAVLILLTTIGALVYKFCQFIQVEKRSYLLAVIAGLLILLAVFVVYQGAATVRRLRRERKEEQSAG